MLDLEEDYDAVLGHDHDEFQPHRTDDPEVWGLEAVRTGRSSRIPRTIYQRDGDNISGIVGRLQPEPWVFYPVCPSAVGTRCVVTDDDGNEFDAIVCWDGAMQQPLFNVQLENGTKVARRESSKGVLLAGYDSRPATTKVTRQDELRFESALNAIEEKRFGANAWRKDVTAKRQYETP